MTVAGKIDQMDRTKERHEHATDDCWDVEAIYPSWEDWEEELKVWGREKDPIHWPEIEAYKKKWNTSVQEFKALIELLLTIERKLSKLYTFAHLKHDEDVASEKPKGAYARIVALLYALRQESSWVEPEILQLPEQQLNQFLESPELAEYRLYIEKIVRLRAHTLSAEQEELFALSGNALETAQKAFGAFNNADLKFTPVEDSEGRQRELTHGKYLLYLRDKDRKVREGAFKNLHKGFLSYENTLCELINGQVQRHFFDRRARKFSSCLEAALFPHQIDPSVYTSLIEAVHKHLPALHRYLDLRKRLLGVSQLHAYDMYVPLIPDVEMSMPYDEAAELIIESVAVLGKDYQDELRKGLTSSRWVDRYENARKRSGAYSSGCYDTMPYILMNYHNSFNDVMTLTHEAGHSMHSLLSRRNQPYQYAQYSIFVAEVASTFHEELLLRHLMKQVDKRELKAFLINQKIDDMRATLLRQTMFAEFELKLHQWVESGTPLTPAFLKGEYRALNTAYFGSGMVLDAEIDIEWARIPHFYYNFYVYQYATGISAAHALVDKVLHGGAADRDAYVKFLSSGSSDYPIDLLQIAGIDMRSSAPVESAMRHFDDLVTQLENLMS